ncbi:MAG: Uma2 family endonuclease [Ginsengibacter sp.]
MAKIVTADYDLDIEIPSLNDMSDEELFNFCAQNKNARIERDENHQIYIMAPAGLFGSSLNAIATSLLVQWNLQNGSGKVFESSAGFFLPDKSMRSPDAAWLSNAKWAAIPEKEKLKFSYVVPEFIIEVMSPSDRLPQLKKKMEKWMENGVLLAWLIVPQFKQAFIYRADGSVDIVKSFDEKLLGEDVLPGFVLDLNNLK